MPDLQVGESKEKTSRTKASGKNSVKAPKPRSEARSQARDPSGQSKAKAMSSDPQGFINKGYRLWPGSEIPMVTLRAKSCIRRGQRASQPPLPWGKGQPARALWPGAIPVAANYCPRAGCTTHGAPRLQTSALQNPVQGLTAWRHPGGGACLLNHLQGTEETPERTCPFIDNYYSGNYSNFSPAPPAPRFNSGALTKTFLLGGKVSRCPKWLGGELSKGVT